MPHTINFTDVTNKGSIVVEDNDINVTTSLSQLVLILQVTVLNLIKTF